jgi:hypothetical protein
MKENARQGFFNGSTPLFGYRTVDVDLPGRKGKKKRLVVDQGEAAIVKRVFDLYLHGDGKRPLGFRGVAIHMNERGLLKRGRRWNKATVQEVLENRAYMGERVFNKKEQKTGRIKDPSEWVVAPVDAIVDKETFERCVWLRGNRVPAVMPPRLLNSPSLLTGLLRCGVCGSVMTLATGMGGRYRYYKCSKWINGGSGACESRNIKMEKLDEVVLDALAGRVFTPGRVELMLRGVRRSVERDESSIMTEMGSLRRELEDTDRGLERLYEGVEKGLLPLDLSLQERAQKHKARREEILVEIARLRGKKEVPIRALKLKELESFCRALRERLRDKSSSLGKDYLRLLVNEIRVEGREVLIKGGYHPIAGIIATKKVGPLEGVPTFGLDWLPGTDGCKNYSWMLYIEGKQTVGVDWVSVRGGESACLERVASLGAQ